MDRKQIINDPEIGNKAEAYEAFDDIPTNPNLDATIGDVINTRYGRRDMLRGMLGVSAAATLFGTSALIAPNRATASAAPESRYRFDELTWGNDETHHIANGYEADVLLRWGDPITADAINDLILEQVRGLGAAAVSITHDMASARKIADNIAMLYEGKIIWHGPADIIDNSGSEYVDQFVHGRAEGPIQPAI